MLAELIIKELKAKGMSLSAIADSLNKQDVPTPSGGGRWFAASVKRVLEEVAKRPKVDKVEMGDIPLDDEGGTLNNPTRDPVLEEEREIKAAEKAAIDALSDAEKAGLFQFLEPLHLDYAASKLVPQGLPPDAHDAAWRVSSEAHDYDGISQSVRDEVQRRSKALHAAIDEIKDQKWVKQELREQTNLLLKELAILRQTNLALRQKVAGLPGPVPPELVEKLEKIAEPRRERDKRSVMPIPPRFPILIPKPKG